MKLGELALRAALMAVPERLDHLLHLIFPLASGRPLRRRPRFPGRRLIMLCNDADTDRASCRGSQAACHPGVCPLWWRARAAP